MPIHMRILASTGLAAMVAGISVGAAAQQPPPPGTRRGIFVMSSKTISDLIADQYEIKSFSERELSFMLQNTAKRSVFICVAEDQRAPKTYCMELSEQK